MPSQKKNVNNEFWELLFMREFDLVENGLKIVHASQTGGKIVKKIWLHLKSNVGAFDRN